MSVTISGEEMKEVWHGAGSCIARAESDPFCCSETALRENRFLCSTEYRVGQQIRFSSKSFIGDKAEKEPCLLAWNILFHFFLGFLYFPLCSISSVSASTKPTIMLSFLPVS